jgi:parvulin-like peptidyl-prolyl isomerase
MSRRERTTGLPRPRSRATQAKSGWRFAGVDFAEHHARLAIIAGPVLLLALVIGLIGYKEYDDRVVTPNHVILTTGGDEFKLSYYTDRLFAFAQADAQANGGTTNLPLLEQQLLTKLEDEALTIQLAKEKGIDLSDDAITQEIAQTLGVPVGGTGSSFDVLYRARLKTDKMSDASFRRLSEAQLANDKLLELYQKDLGDTGEGVGIRAVVTASQADAQKALDRINSGEDMGTVAQDVSTDANSVQNDGHMVPVPTELLPQAIRDAIKDKAGGDTLLGPTQVQTNYWVFRVESRDPAYTYTANDKTQLAQAHLDQALKDQRAKTTIKRSLSGSDIDWATKNAG